MRGGALLFLCSVGLVAGSACSARSLLTIELTAEGLSAGQEAEGNPQVEIIREGTTDLVKTVDKSGGEPNGPFWLLVDDAKSLAIGVYLPGDVNGPMRVTARLVDGACRWGGTASKPVDVTPGGNASSSVTMKREGSCAGATIRDGGTDDANDAGPTLVGDGSADGGDASDARDLTAKCIDYCGTFQQACAGLVQFEEANKCLRTCRDANWEDGTSATAPMDSFACRWDHLKVAVEDAGLRCSECFASSPSSPGICAPASPDAGARDACPPGD